MTEIKRMTPKEFREKGYLQEVNRRYLHPLGLALETEILEGGEERFGMVWDSRDDPEGMIFGPGLIDSEKAIRIQAEEDEKLLTRFSRFGWRVQPYGKKGEV